MGIHTCVYACTSNRRTKVEEWSEVCEDGVWGDGGRDGEGLQDGLHCLYLPTKTGAGDKRKEMVVILLPILPLFAHTLYTLYVEM